MAGCLFGVSCIAVEVPIPLPMSALCGDLVFQKIAEYPPTTRAGIAKRCSQYAPARAHSEFYRVLKDDSDEIVGYHIFVET